MKKNYPTKISEPKIKIREYTKDELKAFGIEWLNNNYSKVHSTPNVAVRGRKGSVKKGKGDIGGIKLFTGLHIEAEVKTMNDKFYPEQIANLDFLTENNALAYVVHQVGESMQVTWWPDYKAIYPIKMQSKK